MAKIGDLFVRLGLKSGEFKKGIQEAQTSTQNFGDKVKNLSAAAKVAWAAIGVAVAKFAANFVKMTQTLGDQWDIAMAGIKGSYGAFVRQLSSGEGWSNLFTNMAEAGRLAREVAASLDEVFERKVSLGYTEAETNRTISELQLIMRDASKSDEERMAAAREIIRLEQELGKTKREVAQQEADAQKKLFMSQTGLNKEETDYLLKNYNLNRDSINQARDYLAERQRLQTKLFAAQEMSNADSGISTQEAEANVQKAQRALDSLDSSTSQAIKDLAELTRKYDKSNDELVNNMANAEVAVINVDTEINRASTRATAMLGSLTEASNRTSGNSTNTEKDTAAGILKRTQDASKTEIELLTEKYAKEKALLEKYGFDTTELTKEYAQQLLTSNLTGAEAAATTEASALQERLAQEKSLLEQYGIDTKTLTDENIKALVSDLSAGTQAAASAEASALQERLAQEKALLEQYGIDTKTLTDENIKALVSDLSAGTEAAATSELDILAQKYERGKALLEQYGADTQALTAAYLQATLDMVTAEIEAELETLEDIEPIEIVPVTMEIDTSGMDDFIRKYEEGVDRTMAITNGFTGAVVAGFTNGCQELMDQLMGLSEANGWAVFKALLEPLADMSVQAGGMMMAAGLAVEAFKSSFLTLNGIPAIVTGAALIAAGTAAKSGLAALAKSGSATNATYSGGGSSYSSSTGNQNIQSELTVYVKGTIKGSDIVLAGNNTLNQWNR